METAGERQIDDVWDGTVGTRRALSNVWIGENRFLKFWEAPPGFEVIDGRLMLQQKTSRPPDIWPEMWQAMSKKVRQKVVTERAAWEERIRTARMRRGHIAGTHGISGEYHSGYGVRGDLDRGDREIV